MATELFSIIGCYTGWRSEVRDGYASGAAFDGNWWHSPVCRTAEEAERHFYLAAHRAFLRKHLARIGIRIAPPKSANDVLPEDAL
jgi:hypothetical protein